MKSDKNSKRKPKPDNLLEWQTWIEEELAPPLSTAVRCNPELRHVLKAFLKVIVYVRQLQG